ncbi:MAG: hypothetical protein ACRD4U_00675 [Candidatus Acidiferrales bacterium]
MPAETRGAKLVVWGFLFAGLLMIAAAIIPVFKGQEVNAAFLAIGALWLILGAAIRKKKSS